VVVVEDESENESRSTRRVYISRAALHQYKNVVSERLRPC
jgi:hypothetical protein